MQILLDEERYSRLAAESQQSGRSVAALIREAIDTRWGADAARRRAAATRVLGWVTDSTDREPDWSETKLAMEQDLIDRLS